MARHLLAAALASAVLATPAHADDFAWAKLLCPKRSDGSIDPTRDIDKEALASATLDAAQVPRRLERLATRTGPGTDRLSLWQTMIVRNTDLCDGSGLCLPGDSDALGRAVLQLTHVLDDTTDFAVTAPDHNPRRFFADDAAHIRCVASTASFHDQPGAIATAGDQPAKPSNNGNVAVHLAPSPFAWSGFRIRGGASDLVFERGTSGFSDAEKATISYGDEDGKRSTKIVLAGGYAQALWDGFHGDAHYYGSLIPYFAANLDWSRKGSDPRNVSSDTVDFGTILEVQQSVLRPRGAGEVDHFEHYLALTPHLVTNYKDHSQVAGLNLLYRPSYVAGLNSLVEIGRTDLWWQVVADARLNSGVFTRAGTRATDDARDFSRAGGRLGVNLASDVSGIPAELTISDTYMWALVGHPGHLSRLAGDLSVYFNEKKYFGLSLGYARGRVEDLLERDDTWKIGLAIKY